jgi:hypothetical protein
MRNAPLSTRPSWSALASKSAWVLVKVRQAIIADKMWFTMIDDTEQLASLPQINRDYGSSLNQRARGLGGRRQRTAV